MGLFSKMVKKAQIQNAIAEFMDQHEDEIDAWVERIENATDTDSVNPQKTVAAYQKASSLCDDFKEYCNSFVEGGAGYLS